MLTTYIVLNAAVYVLGIAVARKLGFSWPVSLLWPIESIQNAIAILLWK